MASAVSLLPVRSGATSAVALVVPEPEIALNDNHGSRGLATKKFEASGVRLQWGSPKKFLGKTKKGTLDFKEGIVSVGTNEQGDVLTFVCPRVSVSRDYGLGFAGSFSAEVEIGKAGGKVDPVTGKGTIYLDDVSMKMWGGFQVPTLKGSKKYEIAEKDAAYVPLLPGSSSEQLVVLDSITPGAYVGQDKSKVFGSYVVKVKLDEKPKQPFVQSAMISVVNQFVFPGLLDQGTSLQWNIDLKAPITVSGL